MRNIGSSSDPFLPAASEIQFCIPIRGIRSEFNPGPNSTDTPAAQHQQRSDRQEPVPALPDLPVHGRAASVSSNSSGYSMDHNSLTSSATSPHQPGTNRVSPTPLSTRSPSQEIHRQLVPLDTLTRTRRPWSFDSFASPCPSYPPFGSYSAPPQHHHCGPVEPPIQGFSQPQRQLPMFDSLLLPLTPSNWIGPNAPGRQSLPASPVATSGVAASGTAASGGVPGVPENINHQSSPPSPPPPPPPPPPREDRAQRSAKVAAKKRKRRGNLSKEATRILLGWFYDHIAHPYPTEDEKHMLMGQAGLQLSQVSGLGARDVLHAFADRACRSATGSSMPDGGSSLKWTGKPRRRCRCGRLSRSDRCHRTALLTAQSRHAKPHSRAVNPDVVRLARLEFFGFGSVRGAKPDVIHGAYRRPCDEIGWVLMLFNSRRFGVGLNGE